MGSGLEGGAKEVCRDSVPLGSCESSVEAMHYGTPGSDLQVQGYPWSHHIVTSRHPKGLSEIREAQVHQQLKLGSCTKPRAPHLGPGGSLAYSRQKSATWTTSIS